MAREPSQLPSTTSRLVNTHRSHRFTRRWNSTNHASTTPKPHKHLCPNNSAMVQWQLLTGKPSERDVAITHVNYTKKYKHNRDF